ncbi:MAG: oxidoreductase [Alphaproteobacteria bacterium]|nr:oxidoreductase [Alphaproteobacteria bacterium]
MSEKIRCLLVTKTEAGQTASLSEIDETALMEGDVTVDVAHSTLNYKDGLAITGTAPVVRKFPLIAGIDFAGKVVHSTDARFKPGDAVVCNGWGMGESHHGGYATRARVKGEWLVPLKAPFSTADAMAIGTAGYTSMLAVMALEDAGLAPAKGPVLVTGAAGGVGSIAIALLSKLGYRVIAATGRVSEADYLRGLGAAEIIDRAELNTDVRPLAKERWAGAVDSVGSKTLANVLASTQYGGVVAACGLAQGMDLPSSVAPFILRGVTLAGIESVYCPRPRRLKAWERLAADLDPAKLRATVKPATLGDLLALGPQILKGQVRGRVVVDVRA